MANKNSLLSIPPPEMKALESLIPEKKPKWLIRAMDPATSTTKANETVRTKSGYSEDLGGEVLVPTIRMGKKGLYKPDNPFKEAIAKKDYILVKGPKGPETAARATSLSRYISDVLITNARKNFQSGGLNTNKNIPLPRFKPKPAGTDKLYSMMGKPSPEDIIIRGEGEEGLTEEARRVYESSRKSGQQHTKPLPEEEGGFFDPLVDFFAGDSEEDIRPVTEEELYGASLEEQKLGLPFAPRKTTKISRKVRKALIEDAGKFPLVSLGLDPRRVATVPEWTSIGQYIPHKDDPKSLRYDHLEGGRRELLSEKGDRPYLAKETDFLVADSTRTPPYDSSSVTVRNVLYHEGMHKAISDLLKSTDYELPILQLIGPPDRKGRALKVTTKDKFAKSQGLPRLGPHATEEALVRLMDYRDIIPKLHNEKETRALKIKYRIFFRTFTGKPLNIDKILEDQKINAELDKLNKMAQKLKEEKGHSSGETFKNFQSGGLNMAKANEQMNMMGFEPKEQEIDPVSGNEVPLGGTPEGVRDDIDAKLSSGEMVIPEYAVNYHGVETYIDSIQKAQEGYQQMQDMGLMGNPDEAIMDESEPLPKMEEEEDVPEYQFGGLASTPIPQLPPETPSSVPTLTPSNISNTPLIQPLRPTSTQSTPVMSQYPNGYFIEVGADQYKFVSPPGAEKQYTDIYTRAQVGNSIIAPVGTTPESVYGPSFQTYGPNYTYSPTQQKTSLLTAGEYKVIPYVNSSGNIFYATSIGGQIQGSIPSGYFPATDQQVDISKQLQTITPKEVPVGGPPSGVTGSGGGGGVSVSGPPSVSTPTPSAQAVATGAEISGSKAPSVMSPVPTPTTADIISSTQPPSFAQTVAGLATDTPDAPAINLGKTPIGELSISGTDIANIGIKLTARAASALLGISTINPLAKLGPLATLTGIPSLDPISIGIGIANNIANHASQPQTAINQSVSGIAQTGIDPISGYSFHAIEPTGLLGRIAKALDLPMMASYNYLNPSEAPLAPIAVLRNSALAHNADLTGMTPSEIMAAFHSNTVNGIMGYSGPLGMPTSEGSYMSDGTFLSRFGISAVGTAKSFSELSSTEQAVVAIQRSKNDILGLTSIDPSLMSSEATSFQTAVEAQMALSNTDDPKVAIQALSTLESTPPKIKTLALTHRNRIKTREAVKALKNKQLKTRKLVSFMDDFGATGTPVTGYKGNIQRDLDMTNPLVRRAMQKGELLPALKKIPLPRTKPKTKAGDTDTDTKAGDTDTDTKTDMQPMTFKKNDRSFEADRQLSRDIAAMKGSTGEVGNKSPVTGQTISEGRASFRPSGRAGDVVGVGGGDGTGPSPASGGVGVSSPSPEGGGPCFIAGTELMLEDKTLKKVEDIKVGDKLCGAQGSINEVTVLHKNPLGNRRIISVNGSRFFCTEDHPFKTNNGWQAVNAEMAIAKYPSIDVYNKNLEVGDIIENHIDEENTAINVINTREVSQDTSVYNFTLSNNHTYITNNFVMHNKM